MMQFQKQYGLKELLVNYIKVPKVQLPYEQSYTEIELLNAKNEIEIQIGLNNSSIVNICEIFEQESIIILVFDYLESGTYQNLELQNSFTQVEVQKVNILRNYEQISLTESFSSMRKKLNETEVH